MDEMEKRVQALEFRVPELERYFKLALREHRMAMESQIALLSQRVDALIASNVDLGRRVEKLTDRIEAHSSAESAQSVKVGAIWAAGIAAVGAAGAFLVNKILGG